MTVTSNEHKLALFPLCDSHGALSEALRPVPHLHEAVTQTRSDAVLFAWMLGLSTEIDAVDAANAILLVAHEQLGESASDYQREIIVALTRYVKEEGSLPSLRRVAGVPRPRNNWRLREARRRRNKSSE